MNKAHLYTFGYEDPSERLSNQTVGTDFESSRQIVIMAEWVEL
jgi:hypothetical protein